LPITDGFTVSKSIKNNRGYPLENRKERPGPAARYVDGFDGGFGQNEIKDKSY